MTEFSKGSVINLAEAAQTPENREIDLAENVKSRFISFAQSLHDKGIAPETTVWVSPEREGISDITSESEVIGEQEQGWLQRIKNYFTNTPEEKKGWLFCFGQFDYMKTPEEGAVIVYDDSSNEFTFGKWENFKSTVKHEGDEAPENINRIELIDQSHFSHSWPKVSTSESDTRELINTLIENSDMNDEDFYKILDDALTSVESHLLNNHDMH